MSAPNAPDDDVIAAVRRRFEQSKGVSYFIQHGNVIDYEDDWQAETDMRTLLSALDAARAQVASLTATVIELQDELDVRRERPPLTERERQMLRDAAQPPASAPTNGDNA